MSFIEMFMLHSISLAHLCIYFILCVFYFLFTWLLKNKVTNKNYKTQESISWINLYFFLKAKAHSNNKITQAVRVIIYLKPMLYLIF